MKILISILLLVALAAPCFSQAQVAVTDNTQIITYQLIYLQYMNCATMLQLFGGTMFTGAVGYTNTGNTQGNMQNQGSNARVAPGGN